MMTRILSRNIFTLSPKILSHVLTVCLAGFVGLGMMSSSAAIAANSSPLPSWQPGEVKNTILDFVADVTNTQSPHFVEVGDRIAVFDNDGTLWSEKPCYFQESFILYRQGSTDTCFPKSVKQDLRPLTEEEKILMDVQFNGAITTEHYKQEAHEFLTTVNQVDFNRPYVELTFQPLLELLDYLRENDFKVYICSGGGIDFIRSFAEEAYGIPPENVIGSAILSKFVIQEGNPVLVRLPIPVLPVNNQAGKPVGIERYIGKRPIMAVGNSTGDLEMLQYTDDGQGRDLMMLVHHDDPDREYQYDKGAEEALVEAAVRGWSVISMKNDFSQVFPWE